MKPIKPLKHSHTSNAKKGMGDYYGEGVRNKVGKPLDVTGFSKPGNAKIKKPPKSLA